MVLFLNILVISIINVIPIIIFIVLWDLIDLVGILLEIVYIIKLKYMNEPTIHCREIIFSILSRKPNSFIFLNTMYPGYSNAFTRFIPKTPIVTITNEMDIITPIIYEIMTVLLYLSGVVKLFLGIIRIVISGRMLIPNIFQFLSIY